MTYPDVLSTSPADNDTEIAVNSALTLIFDASMDETTITANTTDTTCSGSVQISGDNFASCVQISSVSSENGARTFVLKANSDLAYSTTYNVKITRETKDAQGTNLVQEYLSTNGFKTVAEPATSTENTGTATATPVSYGNVSGSITDLTSGSAISGVSVSFQQSSVEIASVTSDANGDITQRLPLGSYVVQYSKTAYITTSITLDLSSSSGTTTITGLRQIPSSNTGVGGISGTIRDAVTNVGVSGVSLNIRKGMNTQTGSILNTATSDNAGAYSVSSLAVGWYSIEAVKSGYNTSYFNVYTLGNNQVVASQDASFSQTTNAETMRIILRWGASPSDLDAYLTIPDNTSTGRFTIYTFSKTYSYSATDNVSLDRDDMSAYGPETVTILKVRSGVYRYSVRDYSNRASTGSTALSQSGAYIMIDYNNKSYRYDVPNKAGTLWEVFSFDGGTGVFTPLNTMSYNSTSTLQ